ncbi:hypothetical protein LLG95_00040 [bacterium]|nr:hypothetical protein [bacterium]
MIPEPELIEIVRAIHTASNAVGSEFFMIGAIARDIRLKQWFDPSRLRSTNDVDFVFAIRNWPHYEAVRQALISRPKRDFVPDPHQKQRIIFRDHFPVDLVPFGGVADKNGQIFWPPNRTPAMTVLGLEDALATADYFPIGSVKVKVASIPALTLLKLIAWNDRPAERPDDIEDFAAFLNAYEYLADIDRFSIEGLMNEDNFDHRHASYILLGRDVGRTIHTKACGNLLLKIMKRETAGPNYDLVSILSRFRKNDFNNAHSALISFQRGVIDILS